MEAKLKQYKSHIKQKSFLNTNWYITLKNQRWTLKYFYYTF